MEIFWIISIITTVVVFLISFMLRKSFPNRSFDIAFGLIVIIICFVCFLFTLFFIGGWEGMAYGFLCFFILIGTITGMLLHQVVKFFRGKYI
ncbi:YesK-like family protein [Bacillus rhizoplanae]|uniref:YesK-like family protein n=1 Tax=Bacillus rhizoplanae TaxID=2880966 RepID=UPI003D196C77